MRAAAIAESKGCRKALRRVTRGAPVSTKPASGAPSNMRDCVATLEVDSTRTYGSGQKDRKKKRTGLRPVRDQGIEFQLKNYFLAAAAGTLAYFLLKRSTRPAVSTSFCLPVKKGWQLEQISTRSISPLMVERVWKVLPQAQWTVTGW